MVFKSTCKPLNHFQKQWLQLRGADIFLNAATRNRFQEYVRGHQWVSKTMIVAERGWHFPPCRHVKSFSRVYVRPSITFKNNDYSWEGLTFTSMPLCEIVLKVHAAPQWSSNTMIIAEMGWHFPPCCYAKSFSRVYARPSMTFKNDDYSWEGLTFTSMPLCEIVFKRTCKPFIDFRKQFLQLRGVDVFLNSAARNRFHKYRRAPQRLSKTMIIAASGWHFPQYRYAKPFWAVHASPSMTLESNDYS